MSGEVAAAAAVDAAIAALGPIPDALAGRVRWRAPLAARTSLGLGGPAAALVEVADAATAQAAAAWAARAGVPVAVLAGGSNTVVADAGVAAIVLTPADTRLQVRVAGDADGPDGGANLVEVTAGAGLGWDALAAWAARRGLGGIAALSGIPGTVGAAPIQNIGAYGAQLADLFAAADVLDLGSGARARWDAASAAFGYRDSAWKRAAPGRYLVLAVTLRLRHVAAEPARYPDLRRWLQARGEDADAVAPLALRAAVLAVRRAKGMVVDREDPDSRSAGSFFVNPTVSLADAEAIAARIAARLQPPPGPMPQWPAADGRVKLSAAWLIEAAGWRRGDGCDGPASQAESGPGSVGVSRKHVLALVHRSGGSAEALWRLSRRIAADVALATGVTLTREPVWLGAPCDGT